MKFCALGNLSPWATCALKRVNGQIGVKDL